MQGTVGYVLIAVGAVIGFLGTTRSDRVAAADQPAFAAMKKALAPAWISVLVIALAAGAYFGMRSQGHGLLGLQLCVGLLTANAIAMSVLKTRAAKKHLAAEALAKFRQFAVVEAIGYILVFAGIYLYLTR